MYLSTRSLSRTPRPQKPLFTYFFTEDGRKSVQAHSSEASTNAKNGWVTTGVFEDTTTGIPCFCAIEAIMSHWLSAVRMLTAISRNRQPARTKAIISLHTASAWSNTLSHSTTRMLPLSPP